jgi:hypothetical protein
MPSTRVANPRSAALLLALAALPAAGLLPSAASAAGRTCDNGGSSHVYSLKTFRGAPCGSALVISSRLANRYNRPADFRRLNSTTPIVQKDGAGRKYTCKWQSGSAKGDIALWACNHGSRVVTWIWRYEAL